MRKALSLLAVSSVLLTACASPTAEVSQLSSAIAAPPSPVPWGAQRTCTTNASGVCTIQHTMGVVPDAVTVSLVNRSGLVRVQSKSATGITLLVAKSVNSSGTPSPWASVSTTFEVTAVYTPVTPSPSPSVSATPSASVSPSTSTPPVGTWPTPSTTGVPAGWTPTSTRTTDLVVTTPGTIVEDVRFTNASIDVRAANVTIRRVEITGGVIINDRGTCGNGMVVEDTSILKGSFSTVDGTLPAVGTGGYTARRVKIQGWPEGFRVSGSPGCGPVTIENSWAQVRYPDTCVDWHGDGLQGYGGGALTLKNTYLELVETSGCGGTGAFFYPGNQGNTSAAVDGLIVKGSGYPFQLGTPGSVRGLKVVNNTWGWGPVSVDSCAQLTQWDAQRVTIDANYQPTNVSTIACG
jgi:hypothetical protein